MRVESDAIVDGWIADRFGGRGGESIEERIFSRSIPFRIVDAPEGTVSYAVVFDDPDAVGPQGFVWIHWTVSGLMTDGLPENASRDVPGLVQGCTSWYPKRLNDRLRCSFYGGPNPPDKVHNYVLKVYALDLVPDLETGFMHDELMAAIEGHVLEQASVTGKYAPREKQ
ncbi:MAG: YbhB/YbcL family Raf kinase inhibitor-like protein [archaeon]|nr:YbhB/YbcL family Raf kinase inhibitor-like protein [archaeon]